MCVVRSIAVVTNALLVGPCFAQSTIFDTGPRIGEILEGVGEGAGYEKIYRLPDNTSALGIPCERVVADLYRQRVTGFRALVASSQFEALVERISRDRGAPATVRGIEDNEVLTTLVWYQDRTSALILIDRLHPSEHYPDGWTERSDVSVLYARAIEDVELGVVSNQHPVPSVGRWLDRIRDEVLHWGNECKEISIWHGRELDDEFNAEVVALDCAEDWPNQFGAIWDWTADGWALRRLKPRGVPMVPADSSDP